MIEAVPIQALFRKFLATFDVDRSRKIWELQNRDFRSYWQSTVLKGPPSLDNGKLLAIIQILDINASRGGAPNRVYEEAVCRAIIYQNFWEGIFKELTKDADLRGSLDAVLKSKTDEERIATINRLKKENKRGNALTGKKAVMLNCFLAAYDAFDNLSMASLEHRFAVIDRLGFGDAAELSKKSYGEQNAASNRTIINGMRSLLGSNADARTISRFLYDDLFKGHWFIAKADKAESEEVATEESSQEEAGIQNFAFENHLEEFLISNWTKLEFAKGWDLITDDDGQIVSRQYKVDVGRIDILARDKGTKDYIVIELKKNRPTEVVVGQIRKYLGWINRNLAPREKVKSRGVIVVPAESEDLKYALHGMSDISCLVYNVAFSVQPLASLN